MPIKEIKMTSKIILLSQTKTGKDEKKVNKKEIVR